MSAPDKPLPRLDDANAPFWEGARQGRLLLQRCTACGAWRFPAARHCAACGGQESRWSAASGRGEVWSFCRFHRDYFGGFAAELPYTVVLVRLAEGALLFSNLVGVEPGRVRIGLPVRACFEPVSDAVTLVKFRPAEPGDDGPG